MMQTIARANRVSEGKSNGLIIDYTANAGGAAGADPTVDKAELLARIEEIVGKAVQL